MGQIGKRGIGHLSNLFTDEDVDEFLSANTCEDLQWYYHQSCDERICDENKLKKAEAKYLSCKDNQEETDSEPRRKLTRSSLVQENKETGLTARTSHVLPPTITSKNNETFLVLNIFFIWRSLYP